VLLPRAARMTRLRLASNVKRSMRPWTLGNGIPAPGAAVRAPHPAAPARRPCYCAIRLTIATVFMSWTSQGTTL
jgi:hypothetical protein